MASKRQRIPKLCHSPKRGYHVSYRDPETGKARRHTFGQISEGEALAQYHRWVADRLNGETTNGVSPAPDEHAQPPQRTPTNQVIDGCIAIVASSLLRQEESRVWDGTGTKARGMISAGVHKDRKGHLSEFLAFLNEQHGQGAVGRMRLEDLALLDVEKYNRNLAQAGLSASSLNKRMQVINRIIDHAGCPEFGTQTLTWNWDSRQSYYGKPTNTRKLPTVEQLQ